MSMTYYFAHDPVSRWMRNMSSFIPAEQHNAKAAEIAKNDIAANMKILDDALAGTSYLVDDKFSFADIAASSYFGSSGSHRPAVLVADPYGPDRSGPWG